MVPYRLLNFISAHFANITCSRTTQLDGEDPNIVFLLRCLYGAVQTVAVLLVLFVYHKANAAASDARNDVVIYVPPPPQVSQGLFRVVVSICALPYIL